MCVRESERERGERERGREGGMEGGREGVESRVGRSRNVRIIHRGTCTYYLLHSYKPTTYLLCRYGTAGAQLFL